MTDFFVLKFADGLATQTSDGLVWFEALPAKTWHTKAYGEVPVTVDKLHRFVSNFKNNVRGIDVAIDYEHGLDVSKGNKASGWIRDMAVRDDSLHLGVEFTDTAREELQRKEWKYFSLEWDDEYVKSEDGTKHSDVVLGGGLTNRPVAKGVVPINFSEFYSESDDDNEGGDVKLMSEAEKRLRKLLGIAEDADDAAVEAAITKFTEQATKFGEQQAELTKLTEELAPLRQLKESIDGKKKFAEEYPEEHKRMTELEASNRLLQARTFSEGYSTIRFSDVKVTKKEDGSDETVVESTTKGLSALALEKIQQTSLKFAEGTVTLGDYKETIDAIMNGGIVDYGTKGSDVGAPLEDSDTITLTSSTLENRTKFSEMVVKVMTDDKLDEDAAIAHIAGKYPELWAAYKSPIVSVG